MPSSWMLFGVFLFVVFAGTGILMVIAKKKWGYTEKRERELEKELEKGGKYEKNRFFNKRR